MKQIDNLLNRISMYKLLLWGLRALFAISWIFSIAGVLPYGAVRPLASISILIGVSFVINFILAKLYKVAANSESTNITALLLYFLFQPPRTVREGIALGLAAVIGIACKYVVVYKERHIFNPAAFGAAVIGLTGLLYTRWWVGGGSMFIFVCILGLLLVRKIHRFPMVLTFVFTAVALSVFRNPSTSSAFELVRHTLVSFPILFLGVTMLTEPVTTPPRRYQQVLYGLVVGLLVSSGLHIGDRYLTPELALLVGNLLVFILAIRGRQPLLKESVNEIGKTIFEYRFKPAMPLAYTPGQYVELTLPLQKTDFRGNRRTFTIASSPTEKEILFGIKEVAPTSAFKTALRAIDRGHEVTANNLAGDFLLPTNPKQKLVFIAGGIGVTPFRSMAKYLTDTKQKRNITLFYCVSDPKQIVYKDIFKEAEEIGLKVVYVLNPGKDQPVPSNWKGETGFLTKELISKHVLDYDSRLFYISGPDVMVQANKKLLRSIGVKRHNIKTDYFSGY